MDYEEIILPSIDQYPLSVRFYHASSPKAVIKIIHGMEEHQGRYEAFASFLAEHGYEVVTADLRGHGKNAPLLSHIADKRGHKLLAEDEKVILAEIKKRYPELPIMLFGHSMGSIIARRMLQLISKEYTKVVLSGYPNPTAGGRIGWALARNKSIVYGAKKHSKMLTNLVLGPFVKAVKDKETDCDWLSYNKDNVKKYLEDPLCGVEFTIGSYSTLFHLVDATSRPWRYHHVNKELPIYLISGMDDPCTGGKGGRKASLRTLKVAGFKNIKVDTLEEMRHEILNETENEKVYNLILNFLDN